MNARVDCCLFVVIAVITSSAAWSAARADSMISAA